MQTPWLLKAYVSLNHQPSYGQDQGVRDVFGTFSSFQTGDGLWSIPTRQILGTRLYALNALTERILSSPQNLVLNRVFHFEYVFIKPYWLNHKNLKMIVRRYILLKFVKYLPDQTK